MNAEHGRFFHSISSLLVAILVDIDAAGNVFGVTNSSFADLNKGQEHCI